MSAIATEAAASELTPISAGERIEALDVVRGFALIGIFLMNVEWFTRPITELGTGVDASQTGLGYLASWFVYTFVQGKFWTMFSLLFGMGFAVMLTRAESTEREFVKPYIRRIIGLFLFGSAHFVMIWTGDILHNYAITALALLLITTRSWKTWLAVFVSALAIALTMQFTDRKPEAIWMMVSLLAVVGVLMHFLNRGSIDRYYKWGVVLYSLPFVIGLTFTGVTSAFPQLKPKETAQQVQEAKTKREERKAKYVKERAEEVRIYTQASYADSVMFRAKQYQEDIKFAAGLSFLALPMFLLGFWFVRSGVITNLRENLGLFRRLATWTLPLGLTMTLVSVAMYPSFIRFTGPDPLRNMAQMLFEWAMLPTCIGYVSLLICLLHTGIGEKILSPLRHAGRMALTNYLGASIIGTLFFSGYGLGYWGQVSRAGQVVFVVVVFSMQLLFSRWWLSKFRYGPMEWLWRAITYWHVPPMRRESAAMSDQAPERTSIA
jgi:uncharacterized protein